LNTARRKKKKALKGGLTNPTGGSGKGGGRLGQLQPKRVFEKDGWQSKGVETGPAQKSGRRWQEIRIEERGG